MKYFNATKAYGCSYKTANVEDRRNLVGNIVFMYGMKKQDMYTRLYANMLNKKAGLLPLFCVATLDHTNNKLTGNKWKTPILAIFIQLFN
ncbi:hypothetical protein PspKH34_19870 [Parageobacillus sp. KH3-4]|nr:hypothetical protein PspKH34_19870 [Parageobacillus sp. KH3-4]